MNIRNTVQSLFWGILTAGISLIFQLTIITITLSIDKFHRNGDIFLESFLFLFIYALSEEFFKYFIILKKIIPLSFGKSFLINSWLLGIGFSLVEIFIIYQNNITNENISSYSDLMKTAPLHILTCGIWGYFLPNIKKKNSITKILLFTFSIHLLYNYSIIHFGSYSIYITSPIILLLLLLNLFYFFNVNKKLASD